MTAKTALCRHKMRELARLGFDCHLRATHRGPTLPANGQITSVVRATVMSESTIELTLPNRLSAVRPKQIRPIAEARLNPARRSEDVVVLRPIEVPKSGRKNGGLQRGTVSHCAGRRARNSTAHE